MYSLALIIFVVSEKKAFVHFPLGSTGHWLTLDPMGKCSNMNIMRYGEMSMRQQPQSQIVSEMPSSQKL
jgi:hypothetical protein